MSNDFLRILRKIFKNQVIFKDDFIHKASDNQTRDLAAHQSRLQEVEERLKEVQGNQPLLKVEVDSQSISEVISGWTGIPTGRMLSDEIPMVLNLETALQKRIIGQDQALSAIARVIRTAHAGIDDPAQTHRCLFPNVA